MLNVENKVGKGAGKTLALEYLAKCFTVDRCSIDREYRAYLSGQREGTRSSTIDGQLSINHSSCQSGSFSNSRSTYAHEKFFEAQQDDRNASNRPS